MLRALWNFGQRHERLYNFARVPQLPEKPLLPLIAVASDSELLDVIPRIHTVPIQRDDTSRSRFAPVFSSQPCEDPVQQFTGAGKPHGEVGSSGSVVQDAVQADMSNWGDLGVFGSAAPTQHPRF